MCHLSWAGNINSTFVIKYTLVNLVYSFGLLFSVVAVGTILGERALSQLFATCLIQKVLLLIAMEFTLPQAQNLDIAPLAT